MEFRSLVSDIQWFSFICLIPSRWMFILSLLRLCIVIGWIQKQHTHYVMLTLPSVLHTACCVFVYFYPSRTPLQLDNFFAV